ncbi:MAG: hypothetical protein M1840_003478 [Geoglossum simile]|nr:MAG: hypothetical protein M1840_003478 [Geoglossum simile]
MDAAAQQYQDAIQKYQPRSDLSNQAPTQSPPSHVQSSFPNAPFDTVMRDPGYEQQQLQQQVQQTPLPVTQPSASAPSAMVPAQLTPQPVRTSTPTRAINGHDPVSRPSSTAPDVNPAILHTAIPHGAPARRYLNEKVTGVLLEGMKNLARDQPKDPLRVLGEYLLQRSRELEGT